MVKIVNLVVARSGLRDREAGDAGFQPVATETDCWDHKVYYPGAHSMKIRVTGDRRTGRLLGAQVLRHRSSEVAKRIDIFATALFNEMSVVELTDLDLSYTPPLGSPYDPVQIGAQEWAKCRRS
jgi:NADPH-dependent 2,4-dienoyl-CoA reductase/sulfur reductase-like enzyme